MSPDILCFTHGLLYRSGPTHDIMYTVLEDDSVLYCRTWGNGNGVNISITEQDTIALL